MSSELRWTTPALRDARKLDHQTRERVIAALERLASDPFAADIRPLAGQSNRWRLRVGDWRVVVTFATDADAIIIVKIAHRSAAYR